MDFLLHNGIADMPGQQFIWLALIYCVITIVGMEIWINSTDSTREKPVPPIDAKADPYELAYLRGAEKEVSVTVLFNLIQQGYLQADVQGAVSMGNTSPIHLNPLEKIIYTQFSISQTASKVLFSGTLQSQLTSHCTAFQQQLIRKSMLRNSNTTQRSWLQVITGAFILEMPMLYKLMVAFAKGKSNVGFLGFLLLVAPAILIFRCRPDRLTSLGKRYLEQCKKELTEKKHRLLADASAQSEAALMVAIFGASILAGTSFDFFQKMFPRTGGNGSSCSIYMSSSSTCSSSCSGSSCGGGGCGGCGGD